jgi:CrcB protein
MILVFGKIEVEKMMKVLFIVGLGGFLGAIGRYLVSLGVLKFYSGSFPLGTLIVNVTGCFLLGLCIFFLEQNTHLPETIKLGLGTGFMGAFTTFSTFGVETHGLLIRGETAKVLLSVGGNLLLGLLAVYLSFHFVRSLYGP